MDSTTWAIVSFLIVQLLTLIKFLAWMYAQIQLNKQQLSSLKEAQIKNSEEDHKDSKRMEESLSAVESKVDKIAVRIDNMAQGLVKVETKVEMLHGKDN